MKNTITILFCALPLFCTAQIKHDYTWIVGYEDGNPDIIHPEYGGTLINFQAGNFDYAYFDIKCALTVTSATVSDESGRLLFYTNGCEIMTREHKQMKNGDEINKGGLYYDQKCLGIVGNHQGSVSGYHTWQGVLILPWPGRPQQYALFHLHSALFGKSPTSLRMTTIDMQQDSLRGVVIEKNRELMPLDSLIGLLTAVRHGNGRDWWIMAPGCNNGKYHSFLFTPEGVKGPYVQVIGKPLPYSLGQSTFSPNGKKYAISHCDSRYWVNNKLKSRTEMLLFDFDRCTGLLSNLQDTLIDDTESIMGGAAFSANSRYLYTVAGVRLYQTDLLTDHDFGKSILIDEYDGSGDSLGMTFYQMMLAPDGKIYINPPNGTKCFHVIHRPERKGKECMFEQRGIKFDKYHGLTLPNFPHFRLFDARDAPCDTLGINGPQPPEDTLVKPLPCAAQVRLYPNPTLQSTWLEAPGCQSLQVQVYDVAGRFIETLHLPADEVRVPMDVSAYAPGMYLLRIQAADGSGQVLPLVVLRR